MLFSRRDHGTKALLHDATRASSRVAEQAQQTISGIAEESKGFAQTARAELGELSREMRDQAGPKVHRARRRAAKTLSQAADVVEPTKGKSRSKAGTLLKATLAAIAGWVLVNVARKAREKQGAGTETAEAVKAEAADVKAGAKAAADKAKAEAEEVKASVHAEEQPGSASRGSAKPAGTSPATRANASSK